MRGGGWPCSGVVALVLLASGCPVYLPANELVSSPCQRASDCVRGYRCVDGTCVQGAAGPVDAAARDAAVGDAVRDGARADGPQVDGAALDRVGLDHGRPDSAGRDQPHGDAWIPDAAVPDQQQPDAAQPDTWVDLPPPPLTSLGATTGTVRGSIDVSVDFPDDVSDYAKVYILRVDGADPPEASCLVGVLAASYAVGHFSDGAFVDTGLTELATYSYRACTFDAADQVTGGPAASAVAMGCWYVDEYESHGELPAKIVDAWAGQWSPSATSPPRQIFAAKAFAGGDRIALASFSGRSITRIYNNRVEGALDCPQQWKLHFKDGAGAILWPTSAFEDLVNYSSGVEIPANAVSAWIGFREGGCNTGSDCAVWASNSPYFDNCDNRLVDGNCEKCDYVFTYGALTCNAP